MTSARLAICLTAAAALLASTAALAQQRSSSNPSSIDAAFEKYWVAKSPKEAARQAGEILKSGVSFDDALRRLKQGRTYTPQASGVVWLSDRTADGIEHHYAVDIPDGYDPARRYQVRVQLHGGVGRWTDNRPHGTGEIGRLAGAEQIYVLPYAWEDEPWWSDDQVLNLNAILDAVKRKFNVDENRVVLSGVSDGATGAYYIAMRDTTPFASFLPLNGFIMVLANDEIDDGGIFPNNLRDKPMFVVNGGRDRLYPISTVEPFTRHLMSSGVEIEYHPQPEGEHNTQWWPQLKGDFEKFVSAHPRDPAPDKLTWETADHQNNRAHWLIIDRLGKAPGEARNLPDANTVEPSGNKLFSRSKGSGRVDLTRKGNTIEAVTRGVTAFTLLLSPDKFDFHQPVKVIANGREVFNGLVTPSVKTLLTLAARDNDRTMLYAAELKIQLTR
jgi:hypothetical protein